MEPRAAAALYLALTAVTFLAVLGLLGFLVVYMAPHSLMERLGLGCVHGDGCPHTLPTWIQFGLWSLPLAFLTWFLGRAGRTAIGALFAAGQIKRLVLARGIRIRGEEAAGKTGSGRHPVYEIDSPEALACTAGILKPVIIISSGLRSALTPEELAVVLAHEEAHADTLDNLLLLVSRSIESALLFLPGSRELHSGLRRALETKADAFATRTTGDALLVAGTLCRVARLSPPPPARPPGRAQAAVSSFGSEDLVAHRIALLVEEDRLKPRRPPLVGAAMLLALVFIVFCSSFYLVSAGSITTAPAASVCVDHPGASATD